MPQKRLMLLGGLRYLLPIIEEAHRLGVHVITADYLPNNIAHKYSDEYCNVSIIDKDAVLKAALELKIDGILSHAVDPGVVSAAYVAEKMGLPFQCSYEAACILQDKSLFRKFLSEHGFNCPKAKGYTDIEDALKDADYFNWPVIVKPVDSAGSKGVTKVVDKANLRSAIETALSASISKNFIVEDFLDKVGAQSSADVFTVDGKLVYPAYSDQLFDKNAANPYTPAIEIWPASMEQSFQDDLTAQLQRLFTLLGVKSGIYNVESRVCSDGKAYIMEVSPRGGGNRIAELQDMATGQSLIANEIKKALGMPMDDITTPQYDGVWCNYILHSYEEGTLVSIEIEPAFKSKYVRDVGLIVKPGDHITPFKGANNSLGTLFLRFDTREELDKAISNPDSWVHIKLK
ncbi:ATP-grasp domain-containing protein [Fibrobacter sp. UWR2]|uniref:ATP-grasp domain-containing protein n=1 Tax=Fibrobacter sp. UWR2 TaxID=1964352 RepID=UPI000B52841E|nr:ATP-grasp domain-containing protein [Fibrobacter sp. UWR2]OWV01822.1 carboxylate--amine ligase [Fibrobacter sp. UWR2]